MERGPWRRRRCILVVWMLTWTVTQEALTGGTIGNAQQGCDPGPDGRTCYFIIDQALNQTEAEAECASRAEGSHLAALTGRMALSHVSHMITSRHVTGAWIGGHYDVPESEQGISTLNGVECGYMAVTASKAATWRRIPCSDGRRFHCLYTSEGGPCRYDFTRCGKYCIRHVNTMFHAPKVDWYHAAQYCLSINAVLPNVASHSDAQKWLTESKLCNFTSTAQTDVLHSWTNFTNLHWYWTTGEDMHFTKWLQGSPQPQEGNCVQLTLGSHLIDIGFKSENCSTTLPAVCQMPIRAQQAFPDLWAQAYHQHHHHAHRRDSPQMPTNQPPASGPSSGDKTPKPDDRPPAPEPNRRTKPPPSHHSTTYNRTPYPTPRPTNPPTFPPTPSTTTTSMGSEESSGEGIEGGGGPGNKPKPPTILQPSPPPPTPRPTPQPTSPPPMQWSQALVVGLVVGGLVILLLMVVIMAAICCCCRRSLPGCKPDKSTDSETAPVRPPPREMQTPNNYNPLTHPHPRETPQEVPAYTGLDTDSGGQQGGPAGPYTGLDIGKSGQHGGPAGPYTGLDIGRSGQQRESTNNHQYTRLQDSPTAAGEARYHETPQDKYYEIAPGDVSSNVGRGRGRVNHPELPPRRHMANVFMADRQLPSIPGEELEAQPIGSERTGSSANYATRSAVDDEWEYLEVIPPPNEERPSRQPSSVSQRSQDSGIDLK